MNDREHLLEIARKLRYDLTAAQGKVSALLEAVNALNLPERPEHVCELCGCRQRGPLSLAEHVYVAHDGPVPPAWVAAEQRADGNSDGH